jgi:hypothetical protein
MNHAMPTGQGMKPQAPIPQSPNHFGDGASQQQDTQMLPEASKLAIYLQTWAFWTGLLVRTIWRK